MCFKMMKYCLRTNKIEEVDQWMVECIQNNKGMAELYVVLEMLLEQIVVLVFFFFLEKVKGRRVVAHQQKRGTLLKVC
jgi:hypothetical protein